MGTWIRFARGTSWAVKATETDGVNGRRWHAVASATSDRPVGPSAGYALGSVVTSLYLALAQLSVLAAAPPTSIGILWLPAGFALACVLVWGARRAGLGVISGAGIAAGWGAAGQGVAIALLLAVSAIAAIAIQSLAVGALLRRGGFRGANVTIPLDRTPAPTTPPPQAQLSGTITGWDALPAPAAGHVRVALATFAQDRELGSTANDITQPPDVGNIPASACVRSAAHPPASGAQQSASNTASWPHGKYTIAAARAVAPPRAPMVAGAGAPPHAAAVRSNNHGPGLRRMVVQRTSAAG